MSQHEREEGEIMEEKEREIRIKELIEARKEAEAVLEKLNYPPKHNNEIQKDSPFSVAIHTAPYPDLEIPDFEHYDGKGDAYRHVSNLETLMRMSGFGDAMLCRIFAASLSDSACLWLGNLRPGSIASFTQFKQEFLSIFERFPKSIHSLSNIKQGPTESLRSYMKRWKNAIHEIPQSSSGVGKAFLYIGINQQSDYYRKLILEDPKSLDEMYVIADRCIAMEDALGDRRNCDNSNKWRNMNKWGHRR